MTRGDEILDAFAEALRDLDALRLVHYDDEQVREIIQRLGSRTERFLKSAVWPGTAADVTLDTLINRLKGEGVSKTERRILHDLRDLYNDAKHLPQGRLPLKRALDTVAAARTVMSSLVAARLGAAGAEVSKVLSRLLWVAAWDVYVGGTTEVYVSLPLPDEPFATHLDLVWIDGLAWDTMKAELLATGCFHYGPDHFPPHVYERFSKEDDFLNAGVWDGDYRQLIAIISKYEHRQSKDELIPDLRRDHMPLAVLSSVALAAVDVASAAVEQLSVNALTAQILERADTTYAMPDKWPWVRARAEQAASLIAGIPFASWKTLTGPFWNLWNTRGQFLRDSGDQPVGYSLDDRGRIVIG